MFYFGLLIISFIYYNNNDMIQKNKVFQFECFESLKLFQFWIIKIL